MSKNLLYHTHDMLSDESLSGVMLGLLWILNAVSGLTGAHIGAYYVVVNITSDF